MAAKATVVPDAASPLRPRKVSSPFIARTSLVFEKAAIYSQDSDLFSHGDSPILSTYRTAPSSRCGSFTLSNAAFKHSNNSTANVSNNHYNHNPIRNSFSLADLSNLANRSRPYEEGKVRKLVTSFSNPAFHPNNTNNVHKSGLKPVRSQSVIIESPSAELSDSFQRLNERRRTNTLAEPPSVQPARKVEQDEEVLVVLKNNKVDDEIPKITFGSSISSSFSHLPIGPIARKNCREQAITDEDGAFYQSSQLLGVQFKESVRSHMKEPGDGAPCLELNPFSPYSPGILNLESTVAFNHQTDNHKSVDLHDFIEKVDFGREETFDYIGQALGSSYEAVAPEPAFDESLNLKQVLPETFEGAREEEVEVSAEDEGEQQEPIDTHEEHVLVVHLEENPATLIQAAQVDDIVPVTETIVETRAPNTQLVQEIIQEPTKLVQAAPVNVTTPIGIPRAISEVHLVTAVSIETFETKETPPAAQPQQSTSQLIQRHDGSMVMYGFPHEPLRASQLLEKRQQRQRSYSKLSGSSMLHLTTSRQANQSGPSSMLASSSTSGSAASSATRLQTPQTSNGSTFERNTTMSEDDTSIPSASGQSSDQDRSSIQSSTETDASATVAAVRDNTATNSSNKKPAKIVTRPKGLSMALGRTFSMMLDITSAATTVGFGESHEHVVSSKVSRTGKLFAQKIKTIANFEYNTSKKLGKGNFGVVYQGKSIQGDEEVAIKKITRKLPGEIEKLGLVQREMKVCRLFRNKTGIVPLLDIITTNKHHYLVFEKAEGDLAEMIKARCKDATGVERINRDPYQQPMSPSCSLGTIFNIHEIRTIMRTVVLGAQSLHHEGFSHKDIKPANILFREGQGLLCDFGLCSQREELPDNQFFGTQDYASPEARRVGGSKKCDYIQGDVYSLGAVLYELATGSVLSKVISQGINWQKLAHFGGRSFSELIQGMVDDLEKRWTIDRVVGSRFWDDPHSDSASAMTAVSDSPFSPLSATVSKVVRQSGGGGGVSGGGGGGEVTQTAIAIEQEAH
ncbi:hypothetical protein EC991_010037 [Linnemannia zychae]|nr:hypothetical protein EC991_010037 [Linnemannia zychae]